MLEIKSGDVFNEIMEQKVLMVHGCNAQGVMGSGVAKLVKDLYPFAYVDYKETKRTRGLHVGQVVISTNENSPVTIANAITQQYYGRDGGQYVDYDGTIIALQAVAKYAKEKELPVHLPLIGGGLGGGDEKRLIAIFQGVFYNNEATLWLKED